MTVKETIKRTLADLSDKELIVYKQVATSVLNSVAAFSDKLDEAHKVTFYKRVVAVRNWLTHFLVWLILALLLSSCFVSGRTIHISTPRVNMTADTATAYSWPYSNNGNYK